MKLYHGSNMEITMVDFTKCRPYKDFGKGFYLTTMREQAIKMANRVVRIYGGSACVSEFEFDEAAWKDHTLSFRKFETPTIEWALFVIKNRNRNYTNFSDPECNLDCKYDLVVGPVADDDLVLLFRQFENDLIDIDTLARGMKYKRLTNQYSFHTDNSLRYLKKVGTLDE